MNIVEKLKSALDILDEVDTYGHDLMNQLSILDGKEQDLLHYIENNKISILWVYRVVKELKKIRVERRKVKNDIELMGRYHEIKSRITSKDNRPFVVAELHKKEKSLQTTYKNRQYSDEELQRVLKGDNDENVVK